tara:strand:+ start:95 stop:433 length:339 start_codon:yes stop_codon:yes gene_type:complete
MGLDQYVFCRTTPAASEDNELFYWRKHADLQGWMEHLYRSKGGEAEKFNCQEVDLTIEDIDRLEREHGSLDTTRGFFFGSSMQCDIEDTSSFIELAREQLNQGHTLYYTSWW